MNDRQTDFTWLQQFAQGGNQAAFRELVRRHIDLVFATALRKAGDAGAAEEIAQNVFRALARKAWQFAPDDSVPAWLHKATLLEATHWVRGDLRRRRREQAAADLGTTMKTPIEQSPFNALVPLLDDALLSLREKDRTVLLLRFYEKQSLRDVGTALGVTEDTAQKRVASALERLSHFFQRRGYKTATTGAAIAALQHTSAAVPVLMVNNIAGVVLQSAPPVLTGVGSVMARAATLTKLQTAAVCIALAVIPLAWKLEQYASTSKQIEQDRVKLAEMDSNLADAGGKLQKLQQTSDRLTSQQAGPDQKLAQAGENNRKWSELKARSQAMLAQDDYRWPDNLPFTRVPKSALSSVKMAGGPNTPDRIEAKIDQFLSLSPSESEGVSRMFTNYYARIDQLMANDTYKTNRSADLNLPQGAESVVFGLQPMGQQIREAMTNLCSDLQASLGAERWAMVKPDDFEFYHYEQVRLLGYEISTWDQRQELAVSISQNPGGVKTATFIGPGLQRAGPVPVSSPNLSIWLPQGPPVLNDLVRKYVQAQAAESSSNPALK